jgi:membrane associated rhomboid family serine protease
MAAVSSGALKPYPASVLVLALCVCLEALRIYGSWRGEEALGAAFDESTLLVELGALDFGLVALDGEYWRLLTHGFVHGGLLHSGLNLWLLWSLRHETEKRWGALVYLVVLLGGVVGGGAAWYLLAEGGRLVGISGGLCALLALRCCDRPLRSDASDQTFESTLRSSLARGIVGLLIFGFVANQVLSGFLVSQAAHCGGLLVGLCAAWFQRGRVSPTILLATLLAFGFAAEGAGFRRASLRGFESHERGKYVEAGALFAEARKSLQREDAELLNAEAYAWALAGTNLVAAEALASRARALAPLDGNILDTQGWILCQLGDFRRGRGVLVAALGLVGESEEVLQHLAACGESE